MRVREGKRCSPTTQQQPHGTDFDFPQGNMSSDIMSQAELK